MCSNSESHDSKMGNKAINISEKKKRKSRYPEIWALVLSLITN